MKIVKAFKYRLKTNKELEDMLNKYVGISRFVWNKFLVINLERLKANQKIMYYGEMSFWLTLYKSSDEYDFLKEAPAQSLQQTLKALEKAFKDCFDKKQVNKRLPKFKKKGVHNSFRYPQNIKLDNNRVFLPKLGYVGFFKSRDILGDIKNATISKRGKHWYVAIQTEYEQNFDAKVTDRAIGIDMGVTNYIATSDGDLHRPVNSLKDNLEKLGKLQKALSRKPKGSNNFNKQKARISKLHIKITDTRTDFLEKLSTQLSKNHAKIVLEDLKVSNMSKSAKGDIDNPGSNVKAKSALNRSILDQAWSSFKRMLEYKSAWNGGEVIKVNPRYTSQSCSNCGHKDGNNRMSQAKFKCTSCEYQDNADINAAKNILAAGHAVSACESSIARCRKQESPGNREILPA